MINMIRADFYRLKRTKGFYLFWIITFALYAITIFSKLSGGVNVGNSTNGAVGKLDLEQVSSNFNFYFLLIMPVFAFILTDFSEKTVKNTISSAISRKRYFITKYILTEIYAVIAFVISNYAFYFVNRLVNGDEYSSDIMVFTKAVAKQLPLVFAMVSAFIMIAFITKKAASFNAITIIFPFIYMVIAQILNACGAKKLFKYLRDLDVSYNFEKLAGVTTDHYLMLCCIGCAIITIITGIIGYTYFTKSEIN